MTSVARTCSVEGCERTHKAIGYCNLHYRHARKGKLFHPRTPIVCSVEGCVLTVDSKGLCNAHYKRARGESNLSMEAPVQDTSSKKHSACGHSGCEKSHYSSGFCVGHYQRSRSGTPMDQPWEIRGEYEGCLVDGCDRPHSTRGYCAAHHRRLERGTSLEDPIKAPDPKRAEVCEFPGCVGEVRRGIVCMHHKRQSTKYGISQEQFIEMSKRPCDICGSMGRMCVDHDHSCCPGAKSCGKCIRGRLCSKCNSAIGLLQDDVGILQAAIQYLSRNGID